MAPAIALLCLLHPTDASAKTRVQSLLASHLLPHYHTPAAQCLAWTQFNPSTRKGAPTTTLPKETPRDLVIGTFELYADKSALSAQLDAPAYKAYHQAVNDGKLYSQPEEIVAWTPRGGFFTRDGSQQAPKGVIVMTAVFTCKDGAAAERVVKRLARYADWVKENEGDVLTYAVLSRRKAEQEVLMFERYESLQAIGKHGSSKEFKGMFGDIKGELGGKSRMSEWVEGEGAFVGGGDAGGGAGGAKL